jgi:hypothetical protein
MPKAKVKIKISGSPESVHKALAKLTPAEKPAPILREADFLASQRKNQNG